jgi:hypothetical protein
MGFRLRLDLHVTDQDCPNSLTDDQQDLINRFRRDIIGAQSVVVSVRPDAEDSEFETIFVGGSVPHAANQS